MAAIDYKQCLDYGATEDDFRAASAPAALLGGAFTVHYIPAQNYDDHAVGTHLYLVSVDTAADHAAFRLRRASGGDWVAEMLLDGASHVEHGEFQFSIGQRMAFTFDGPGGTVAVSGSTDPGGGGDGITVGDPWSIPDGEWRLGGHVNGSDLVDGYISLPYAAQSDPYIPSLDFSDYRNSQYAWL